MIADHSCRRTTRWKDIECESTDTEQRYPCAAYRFSSDEAIRIAAWPLSAAALPTSLTELTAADVPRFLAQAEVGVHKGPVKTRGTKRLSDRLDACLSVFASHVQVQHTWHLKTFEGNEAQVRMVLDVILQHLCRKHRLRLALEEPVPKSSPFAGKADYILLDAGQPVAIIEAKRNLGSVEHHAETRLFGAAMAQSYALLAGFLSEKPSAQLLGIVTDARGWLLMRVTPEKQPVLQLWPEGHAILELNSQVDLAHLLHCLEHLLLMRRRAPYPARRSTS